MGRPRKTFQYEEEKEDVRERIIDVGEANEDLDTTEIEDDQDGLGKDSEEEYEADIDDED